MTDEYTFKIDEQEVARYRGMAAQAFAAEREGWDSAGITPGARVVDLGCGPGAFLPTLAERVGPAGRITGVDRDAASLAKARELLRVTGTEHVQVREASADDTRLEAGIADTVFMRHVLMHNDPGGRRAILGEVERLLDADGRLFAAETSVPAIDFGPTFTAEEAALERRWIEMMRARSCDPAIGPSLEALVGAAGFDVLDARTRVDRIEVDRSPSWTAAPAIVDAGLATAADVNGWDAAITRRLENTGKLEVGLPVWTVVAQPR